MELICPLCNASTLLHVDRVSVKELDYCYRKSYGITVFDQFFDADYISFYNCKNCKLGFFYPLVGGTQSFYQKLNCNKWYYLEDKSEYKTVATLIPKGAAVLDIGCGEGKFARLIPDCEYVGLEKNLSAQLSREDGHPLILPELIAEHSRSYPSRYDFVCSFQVLEHVADVRSFIEDSLKCLRFGGRLIISVPAAESFISQTVNGVLNMPPHHLTWWPDQSLIYVGNLYGLTLESIIHERLERVHYRRYAFNWAWSRVSRKFRLIDRSLVYWVGSLLLLPVAFVRWLFLLLFTSDTIYGHSVVAVYRKGNNE